MNSVIEISGLQTSEQAQALQKRILQMIGVEKVDVDINMQKVSVTFDTPTNLNSIEKEIYDDGYKVLN
ncbi:heavy-metal-associated domain-containing protein [Staphylococcus taiwanensis]|nr:heavy-metal-associated domain-containing protein [Staphylococcus taiwanensis]